METEETIEVRKQDGSAKPGSMGRYGCRLFSAQPLSNGLLSLASPLTTTGSLRRSVCAWAVLDQINMYTNCTTITLHD